MENGTHAMKGQRNFFKILVLWSLCYTVLVQLHIPTIFGATLACNAFHVCQQLILKANFETF